MGAIVTIKVRPGTDARDIKQRLERELAAKTGENVTVNVSVSSQPQPQVYLPKQ
jgi:hypothetical protein